MAESHAACTSDSKICAAKRVLEQNLAIEDKEGMKKMLIHVAPLADPSLSRIKENEIIDRNRATYTRTCVLRHRFENSVHWCAWLRSPISFVGVNPPISS